MPNNANVRQRVKKQTERERRKLFLQSLLFVILCLCECMRVCVCVCETLDCGLERDEGTQHHNDPLENEGFWVAGWTHPDKGCVYVCGEVGVMDCG